MSAPSWIIPGRLTVVPYHQGVLSGSLAIAASGVELPSTRRVYIWAESGHGPGSLMPVRLTPVADVRPDAQGLWSAAGLDPDRIYTVISYDPTGQHAPAIQSGLLATVPGNDGEESGA